MPKEKKEKKEITAVTRDYTLNMHKRLHKIQFKKRAPRAIREIKRFAQKEMFTKDVRVDTGVSHFIWSRGIRNVPRKVRVRLSRKQNDDEDAKEEFYTLVQHVQVEDFRGMCTENAKTKMD